MVFPVELVTLSNHQRDEQASSLEVNPVSDFDWLSRI